MSDHQDIKYSSAKHGKNVLQTPVTSVDGLRANAFVLRLGQQHSVFKETFNVHS